MSIALSGLRAAIGRLQVHSENIANQQSEGFRPLRPVQTTGPAGEPVLRAERLAADYAQQRLPGTDLIIPQTSLEGEMAGMMMSETAYKASAKLIKTARALDQALLDIVS